MDQLRSGFEFLAERWAVPGAVNPRLVLITAAAVLFICAVPSLWRVLRQASTIIHEMGHVLAALLSRRRVSGIRLHSDTSGLTVTRGRTHGPGMLFTILAGYPAPGLLALGMAALLTAGYTGASLTLYNLVVLAALLLSRNVVGVISCLVSLGVTGAIWWFNDPEVVSYTVVVLAVFYALAGVRGTLDVIAVHLRAHSLAGSRNRARPSRDKMPLVQRAAESDAGKAAYALRGVRIPAAIWLAFFLAISGASAAGVVWLLVRS